MFNYTVAIIIFVVAIVIFELIRRRSLREKYAFVWVLMIATLATSAVFKEQINLLSKFLGFEVLSNFILMVSGLVLLFVVMQMSLELGKVEDKVQTLAEEIAILKDKTHN